MPHNFIRISATTPNPGRRRLEDVETICRNHHGHVEFFGFDAEVNPNSAFVLVKGGDVDGMMSDLGGFEAKQLFDPSEVQG